MNLDAIYLEPHQRNLLAALVEAHRNLAPSEREEFLYIRTFGLNQVQHSGLPDGKCAVFHGDMEALRLQNLIVFSGNKQQVFYIAPAGLALYNRIQQIDSPTVQSVVPQGHKEYSEMTSTTLNQRNSFRVFISHSTNDKPFVRRLADDLNSQSLDIWVDERELKVGDSIVQGISDGLKDTDYLVIVLSPASVESEWVKAELNAALMNQLSNKGTVVLPVLIENCDIPVLLRDRIYADFRTSYDVGFEALLRVFKQEATPVEPDPSKVFTGPAKTEHRRCCETLAQLKQADLRRLITQRMNLAEVRVLWFDTLNSNLDDEMPQRSQQECVVDLLIRAEQRGLMEDLLSHICHEREDLANP